MGLTRILEAVKSVGKELGLAAVIGASVFGFTGKADADGALEMNNYVNSQIGTNTLGIVHFDDSEITDGYNSSWDVDFINPPDERSALFSDLNKISQGSFNLRDDYRLNTSNTPYMIELVYNGTLSQPTSNSLFLDMPYGPGTLFEDKSDITLREVDGSGNLLGNEWDVRDIILNYSGIINLDNLPAGDYNPSTPYGHLQLDFDELTEQPPSKPIPEPTGLALLALGAAGIARRKTKEGTNPKNYRRK